MGTGSITKIASALSVLLILCAAKLSAADVNVLRDIGFSGNLSDLKDIKADQWSVSGGNIVVKGNVHVPFGVLDIYADEAVVNIENRDIEAYGNLSLYTRNSFAGELTPDELERLNAMSGVTVQTGEVKTNVWGEQKIQVRVSSAADNIKARKLSGNLISGYLQLEEPSLRFRNFVATAKRALRKPDGTITLTKAEISTCEYLEGDNAHYTISCGEAVLVPHQLEGMGMEYFDPGVGNYTVWGTNCAWKFYGIPVLWMPVMYKPKDENPGLFWFQVGNRSNYGYFASFYKRFDLSDYPYSSVKLRLDYFNLRGVGYGFDGSVGTENSRTTINVYSIYDLRPYNSSEVKTGRLEIPHDRYSFGISNVTHITPTFDLRGTFYFGSDYYVNRDYSSYSFLNNPEPATYLALEKSFDNFSTTLYLRPRVNDFYTTVERLPEWRLDIPRQEIFGNSNLYYQGENSIAYLQMRWRKWDKPLTGAMRDPDDYQSFRFDSLHFLYYPITLDWINIVPRAGVRFTDYTGSSKTPVTSADLGMMFRGDSIGYGRGSQHNYDSEGGNVFRVATELGVEASTKFYSSWQDVRNAYMRIDGLRHVIEPYTNYTFIPSPSEDRDYIYAFDDVDRIHKQHFIRLGLFNRLQTRDNDAKLIDFLTMENYWDYFFYTEEPFKNAGDFCTKLTWRIFKNLQTSALFSIDVGGNSTDLLETETVRYGRTVGHPGLFWNRLNRLKWDISYAPAEGYLLVFGYNYNGRYRNMGAYSMGSTLARLSGGSVFDNYYLSKGQTLNFGITVPLTSDRRTSGYYSIDYDFERGFVQVHNFGVMRRIHCWDIALEYSLEHDLTDKNENKFNHSFMLTGYLSGLNAPLDQVQNVFSRNQQLVGSISGSYTPDDD